VDTSDVFAYESRLAPRAAKTLRGIIEDLGISPDEFQQML
jgi:hypothetical protein